MHDQQRYQKALASILLCRSHDVTMLLPPAVYIDTLLHLDESPLPRPSSRYAKLMQSGTPGNRYSPRPGFQEYFLRKNILFANAGTPAPLVGWFHRSSPFACSRREKQFIRLQTCNRGQPAIAALKRQHYYIPCFLPRQVTSH